MTDSLLNPTASLNIKNCSAAKNNQILWDKYFSVKNAIYI